MSSEKKWACSLRAARLSTWHFMLSSQHPFSFPNTIRTPERTRDRSWTVAWGKALTPLALAPSQQHARLERACPATQSPTDSTLRIPWDVQRPLQSRGENDDTNRSLEKDAAGSLYAPRPGLGGRRSRCHDDGLRRHRHPHQPVWCAPWQGSEKP